MLICSGGMDPWILFCAGEWVAMFDCLVWIFRRGLGFQAVLNYCQHILCRNNYLYLSFAFVNNIVHTTALHWTQIIAINAASKNTDHSLLILLWSFFVKKKISSFYFFKIIGPPISLWNFYLKQSHSIFESINRLKVYT